MATINSGKMTWQARQHRLNLFFSHNLKGVAHLREDGVPGHMTRRYIRHAKWYLGYKKGSYDASWNQQFHEMLIHPVRKSLSSPATVARGIARRLAEKRHQDKPKPGPNSGLATFDGRTIAAWLKPYLVWARQNGWRGTVVSGYRDPAYSESLCLRMCGRPRCPGTCAGRSSNHSGSVKPHGAIDVSFYWDFARIIAHAPFSPRIFNNLPNDRVHFSATGN